MWQTRIIANYELLRRTRTMLLVTMTIGGNEVKISTFLKIITLNLVAPDLQSYFKNLVLKLWFFARLTLHCKLLQIDYRQTKVFVCKLLDFCYNYRQILAKTTAPQTNDCRYNSWLYLDFEHRQTSVYSTAKTFAVWFHAWKVLKRGRMKIDRLKYLSVT